jgi:hypothetical protein
MTKMKGGLLLNDTHESKTIEDAIYFFKTNSTFSILTNTSLACITFKATLNKEVISPFIQIRSGIIEQPVTTLLFKYFPMNSVDANTRYFNIHFQGVRQYIALSQAAEIKKEFDIQLQVYQTTYNTLSSAYEPVCPYPIHYSTDLNKAETIKEIIDRLDANDKALAGPSRITDTLGGDITKFTPHPDDAYIYWQENGTDYNAGFGAKSRALITTLGCIVMEFMDDYTTLLDYIIKLKADYIKADSEKKKNVIKEAFGQSEFDEYEKITAADADAADNAFHLLVDKQKKKIISLATYELVRLKEIGFIHGDLHMENVMYNPNYKYITNDDKEVKFKGRALIIDFGLSLINKEKLAEEEEKFYKDEKNEKGVHIYEAVDIYGEDTKKIPTFYDPYTFEEIYRRRLDVTLAFREIMIQGLEQMLTEYNALTTEKEKTKFVQDKKIQLKLGLIRNLKWPTNFVNPNVGDFEKEEFDTPFKDVQIPIFEKSNKKIQTLTQKRDEIIPKVQALIELKESELPQAETTLETKATKAFNRLEYLTNKFTILFHPTPSLHGGGRYINSHKTQNAFSNRLKHRTRTTLRIKRRKQTKRRKRGKRSKKGKRKKQTKRKKINN